MWSPSISIFDTYTLNFEVFFHYHSLDKDLHGKQSFGGMSQHPIHICKPKPIQVWRLLICLRLGAAQSQLVFSAEEKQDKVLSKCNCVILVMSEIRGNILHSVSCLKLDTYKKKIIKCTQYLKSFYFNHTVHYRSVRKIIKYS